ncbi:MAG: hypothetical protein Q8941_20540 [Bacteroidota bacterium]|nr:hypothetical protein [Bacteroidota bacterium]
MIKKASDCSVRLFMRALFEDDRSQIDNFDAIWTEWVDLSGVSETREKDLLTAIHNIHVRQLVIPEMIQLQLEHLRIFKQPYFEDPDNPENYFKFFRKYGHRLSWNDEAAKYAVEETINDFINQLKRVDTKERQFVPELAGLEKELKELKKEGVKIDGNGRKEFIKLLNDVGKYRRNDIDRDKTDVETFAIMVRDFFDRPAKQ